MSRNTRDANRQVVIALPNHGDCESAEYSIVVTYNKIY